MNFYFHSLRLSIEVNKNEINYQSSTSGARTVKKFVLYIFFYFEIRASKKAARQGMQSLFLNKGAQSTRETIFM